jgi:hypothetical protein
VVPVLHPTVQELSYDEGGNLFVEERLADSDPWRFDKFAVELAGLNLAVIMTDAEGAHAAHRALGQFAGRVSAASGSQREAATDARRSFHLDANPCRPILSNFQLQSPDRTRLDVAHDPVGDLAEPLSRG